MEKQCKQCNKPIIARNYVYSYCHHDYICLDCYHQQFPRLPHHPTPISIQGYNHDTKLLNAR